MLMFRGHVNLLIFANQNPTPNLEVDGNVIGFVVIEYVKNITAKVFIKKYNSL